MKPLAYRMRPANIEDIIGQEHLVKEDKIIGRMVRAKHLSSMILYGRRASENVHRHSDRRIDKHRIQEIECRHS